MREPWARRVSVREGMEGEKEAVVFIRPLKQAVQRGRRELGQRGVHRSVRRVVQATENDVGGLFQWPDLVEGHAGIGYGRIILVGNPAIVTKDLPFCGLD